MMRARFDIYRWGLLATTLVLLQAVFDISQAVGQSGLLLPGLVGDAGNMGDLTENNGVVTATVTVPGADLHSPAAEMPAMLIDNLAVAPTGTKWLDFRGDGWENDATGDPIENDIMRTVPHISVNIDLGAAANVGAYTISSANDVPTRDPYSWTLAGTNVVDPVDADFVEIHSITAAEFTARFQTRVFEIPTPPATAYRTYRFSFLTEDVALNGIPPAPPASINGNVIQVGEIELLTQFVPSDPRLTIDRTTGAMNLLNATVEPLNILGYSITSPVGTLNSNTWQSVTENYDGNSGGSLDDDNWVRLTEPNGRNDLGEVEEPDGDGLLLPVAASIDLGNAWIKYPLEDLQAEVLLADGTVKSVIISFTGNNDEPFVFGDLNFSGGATPITITDWNTFKQGHGFDFSTVFSKTESYAKGDLDGDFDHDGDDFGLFKATYDAANGAGSFEAMLAAIPEPSSAILLSGMAALLAAMLAPRRWGKFMVMLGAAFALTLAEPVDAGEVLSGLRATLEPPVIDLTDADNMAPTDVTILAGDAANSPMTEMPPMALDNSTTTKWLAFQPNGTFYQVQFNGGAQHAVNTYTITSANDSAERDPYRWTLSGSNNGTDFTVVDAQSAQDFTARGQTQQFVVANETPYNIYRFDFQTALGAGAFNPGAPNSIQLAEIELINDPDPDILTLEVDPEAGSLRLANNSDDTITFDYYRVRSAAGALNRNAWWGAGPQGSRNGGQSIHDQNIIGFPVGNGTGNGWEEGPGSTNFEIAEYYLGTGGVGNSALGSEQGITMNNVFQIGGAQDLVFEYRSHGQNVIGFVEYLGGPGLVGDYNGDGSVDAADYTRWRDTLGSTTDLAADGSGNGSVGPEDFELWKANFGDSLGSGAVAGAANVPEPSSFLLTLAVPGLLLYLARSSARRRVSVHVRSLPLRRNVAAVLAAFVCLFGASAASASTLDRDYQFGDDSQENAIVGDVVGSMSALANHTLDSETPFQDLMQQGGPEYADTSGRPDAGASEKGIEFTGASSQFLVGAGLGSPAEGGGPIGRNYAESRLMQVWVRPTLDNGMRQEIVSDTFQFGIFLAPTAAMGDDVEVWGHTYGSDAAPPELGDDFLTTAPVVYNEWTHVMQRTFENDGVALYINGVAVSRFNADYEAATNAITPEPNRAMYVGAGSGGATNFFTGQLDNLKLHVAGDNTAAGGQNWGAVDLATENEYIAFALAQDGFVHGDVNGDGVVNGTGTGPVGTDDVSFFIAHWLDERRVNNILVGDLISRTTLGDLNFDGRTSLADWFILRSAHAAGASLDLAALLAGGTVPEPATLVLMAWAGMSMWGISGRRRRNRVTRTVFAV